MKFYLQLLLILGISFWSVLYYIYHKEQQFQKEKLFDEAQLLTHDLSMILQEELTRVSGDLFYLTAKYKKQDTRTTPIHSDFADFMHYRSYYTKLAVYGVDAKEHFRISSDQQNVSLDFSKKGSLYLEQKQLQEALELKENEVISSALNTTTLQKESFYTVASPLFNLHEQIEGVLVLKISLEPLFEKLQNYTKNSGFSLYVMNAKGDTIVDQGALASDKKLDPLLKQLQTKTQNYGEFEDLLYYVTAFHALEKLQAYDVLQSSSKSSTLQKHLDDANHTFTILITIDKTLLSTQTWASVSKGLPYLIIGFIILAIFLTLFSRLLNERMRTATELKLAANCFENAEDGMVITDAKTNIIKVNKRYVEITGYSQKELLGNSTRMIASGWTSKKVYEQMWNELNEHHFWEGEITDRRRDGSIYTQWLRIIAIVNENAKVTNYLGVSTDITQRKHNEERINKLVNQDPLTSLPNRNLFEDRLAKAIEHARRYKRDVAVLFIDLDDFKLINDTSGHYIGDMLLMEVAKKLKNLVQRNDTLARFGGDEFVILLEDYDKTDVGVLSQKILNELKTPLFLNEMEYLISASIGIAIYPDDANDKIELLQHADTAMYKAKDLGKNNYCFYQLDMNIAINFRLSKEKNLKKAMQNNELYLLFQPQISLTQKRVTGLEALMRWENKELGFVSPEKFIHVAESLGLIVPFTEFVLEQSCQALVEYNKSGIHNITIAVNISSLHIKELDFVAQIYKIVSKYDIDPKYIELEITEGALIENIDDTIAKLQNLQALGFSIAIDDFGTGYSSLSYLKRFNFNKLKIDRAFVQHLPTDLDDISIIKAIIAVAKALNMKIVAEGAETQENIRFLEENGCDIVQGFFFSKPLTLESSKEYIQNFSYPQV